MTASIEELASGSVLSQAAYKDFPEGISNEDFIAILEREPQEMTEAQAIALKIRDVARFW